MPRTEHVNEADFRDRERIVAIIRDTARRKGWLTDRAATGYEFTQPVEIGAFARAVADALHEHDAVRR